MFIQQFRQCLLCTQVNQVIPALKELPVVRGREIHDQVLKCRRPKAALEGQTKWSGIWRIQYYVGSTDWGGCGRKCTTYKAPVNTELLNQYQVNFLVKHQTHLPGISAPQPVSSDDFFVSEEAASAQLLHKLPTSIIPYLPPPCDYTSVPWHPSLVFLPPNGGLPRRSLCLSQAS